MIKNWLITGDAHGKVAKRLSLIDERYAPAETAVIILGDAGLNYYKDYRDSNEKQDVQDMGYLVYCVRGNHEDRPQNIDGMNTIFDENVWGYVFIEDNYPNIRYFQDGGIYKINEHRILVIGGAYSVDKEYRLANHWGWFPEEQLSYRERCVIEKRVEGDKFDFVLTHTCPVSWEPTDMFLSMIDQKTVDRSMEIWLDELKDKIDWNIWCWGHFHNDRTERPHCEMFFSSIVNMEDIWNRWNDKKTYVDEWYLAKSPMFHSDDNKWAKEYT